MAEPLPRFLLAREYRVTESGEETLAALLDPSFDFRRIVLLEREPDPPPRSGRDQEQVELIDQSTDHLTLEIELDVPERYFPLLRRGEAANATIEAVVAAGRLYRRSELERAVDEARAALAVHLG